MIDVIKSFFFNSRLTEDLDLEEEAIEISDTLRKKIKKLGSKSIAIRAIDAGSTNNCEHEIAALENPFYDIHRFGIKTVASPRHADLLFVTGPVTAKMKEPLIKAYEATPEPKIVFAIGDGAVTGRISTSVAGKNLSKVSECIPVDYEIYGDPPCPEKMIKTLLGVLKNA